MLSFQSVEPLTQGGPIGGVSRMRMHHCSTLKTLTTGVEQKQLFAYIKLVYNNFLQPEN